jgi:hypothetical protein
LGDGPLSPGRREVRLARVALRDVVCEVDLVVGQRRELDG